MRSSLGLDDAMILLNHLARTCESSGWGIGSYTRALFCDLIFERMLKYRTLIQAVADLSELFAQSPDPVPST